MDQDQFFLTIDPHDPVVARDSRPFGFGQGQRMRSLDWLYPSVLAGSFRTLLGKSLGYSFSEDKIRALLDIAILGPLPMVHDTLYFPASSDLVIYQDAGQNPKIMPLRPMPDYKCDDNFGCDLNDGLSPVIVSEDVKPKNGPGFWSYAKMCEWLLNPNGMGFPPPPILKKPSALPDFLNFPEKDERVHVAVGSNTGAAVEGKLFKSIGLDCVIEKELEKIRFAGKIEVNGDIGNTINKIDQFHPLGGERRLGCWKCHSLNEYFANKTNPWKMPNKIQEAFLREPFRIRMVLATPGIFKDGWKPGWLNADLEGKPPGVDMTLKLISACIERWRPISGWSLEKGMTGPKPIRRMVPAGAVYFFTVQDGNPGDLAKRLWLRSVCDDEQSQRDGFGLALWGVWDYANNDGGGR